MQKNGTHPMVRINYAIRAGSFAYSFIVVGIHGLERDFGAAFWAALALQFLVYPHLAYLHARRAADPQGAERINLYADAALLGAWIGGLHFPLWLAYSALFSTALNATVVLGLVRGSWSVASFGIGAAIAMAFAGFESVEETSPLVTALCFLGSFAYTCVVGAVVYMLRNRLGESEARYRLLAENAADLVAIIDKDGRWVYASPSYEAVLDAEDLVAGGDAFAHVHPDDASKARIAVLRSASTGELRELQLRLVDRGGRIRQYKASVQPVKGEGLPAARLVLASRDVTDLRESEERLLIAVNAKASPPAT
jgi:PAS domain S-box-containing protein